MYKKSNNKKRSSALLRISLVLAVLVFLFSCRNEDTQKQPVIVTDTAASPGSGRGAGDAASKMDSSMSGTKMISKEIKKDSAQSLGIARAKGKKADRLAAKIKDSLGAAGKASLPAVHDNNAAAADNSNINVSGNTKTQAVFVPKYGVIPRNTTETNISDFADAFPDKTTLIKINFDGDPDADMQGVKSQIAKVLKKLGYTNVNSQSTVLNPVRMPTEIHYELQRDGSVVIWVPVAGGQ